MKHLNYLRRVGKAVFSYIHDRPLLGMSIETGVLMGTGDLIAQKLLSMKTDHEFQPRRFLTFAGIGFFFVGPCVGRWYYFLDRNIRALEMNSRRKEALAKVMADQLMFAPVFMAAVMVISGFLIGNEWEKTKETLQNNYFSLLLANYKVWPLFLFINFSFVPLRFNLMASQLFAIMWNTYLSLKLFS
ncbi:protein Mpv17 [Anabrus simplex]|uniref:protein Mpv17 n=1 Tax=Anabrus simplex TaxID=316456 RepID=UPI0035A37189